MINPCSNLILPLEYGQSISYEEQIIAICQHLKNLEDMLNGQIDSVTEKWLNDNYNNLMVKASYNEANKALVLTRS